MRKKVLKDGYIIEIEWSALKPERYIKLGEDLVGPLGNVKLYILEDDLIINQGLNAISKVTKVFENCCMTDLNDIENDDCLTLLWKRPREIDWSKVPKWTPIQAWDENEKYTIDSLLVAYEPELRFGLIVADNKDDEPRGYKHCKIHPSVETKEEWYK